MTSMYLGLAAGVLSLFMSGCVTELGDDSEALPEDTAFDPAEPFCRVDLSTDRVDCFATFQELMSFASGGALADITEPAQLTVEMVQAIDPETVIGLADGSVVSADYSLAAVSEHSCGWGPCGFFLFYTAAEKCFPYGNATMNVPTLSEWWNDRISGVTVFNNCWVNAYEHAHYGGASITFTGTGYVGDAWNDKISSFKIY